MRPTACLLGVLLLLAACSSDGDHTVASTTTLIEPDTYQDTVEALADDAMGGRDNQTTGSDLAQDYLIDQLTFFADPLGGDYRHPFADGTNILAVIPGTEKADEYVILGAHYDHLGRDCPSTSEGDDICNGATDNATGVASVLEIGRRVSANLPERSVILAFWDAEEDGLLGSAAYVADPVVPLAQTTAYLNWDIQGSNLLPSLASTTVIVGAETGGPALVQASDDATHGTDLDPLQLSLLFGQGRSDHATFVDAGVPSVFFTDSTAGCYHTAQDDTSVVDVDKLGQQISIGEALARDLVATDTPPTFVGDAPVATYDDAESMLAVVSRAQPDFGLFSPERQAVATQFLADLEAMHDAGPDAFDDQSVGVLLGGSADVVALLAESECDAYLDD